MSKYKSMSKSQLAAYAGVSRRTLYNWLLSRQEELLQLGALPNSKALPPAAVRYICETFCIDIDR